jgi:hypothetical protein
VVHDYTDVGWAPYVAQTAADWDAALASRRISVEYVKHDYAPCAEIERPQGVTVCEDAPLGASPLPAGSPYGDGGGTYAFGRVRLYVIAETLPWPARAQQLVCHELGHVFGLDHQPEGTVSCLAPYCPDESGCGLTTPGPVDAANAIPFRVRERGT